MSFSKFTLYRHPDWDKSRKSIPLLRQHHITTLVDAILNHNVNNGFTGVNFIGESGTGKTTIMTTIIHRLQAKKEFTVKWFSDYDLTKLIDILDGLESVPTILVFDDATDSFHDIDKNTVKKIAKKLTRVRHDVGAPVMCFLAFHYSKAMEKIFRNVSIKVMTSISDEERVNYSQLFRGSAAWQLLRFSKLYYNQTFKSYFQFVLSAFGGGKLVYQTNKPFRVALVAGVGQLKFVLYPAESCNKCVAKHAKVKTQHIDAQKVVDTFLGHNVPKQLITQVLRQYLFTTHGYNIMAPNFRAVWNNVVKLDRNYFVDWEDVAKLITEKYIHPRGKYRKNIQEKSISGQIIDYKKTKKHPTLPSLDTSHKNFTKSAI